MPLNLGFQTKHILNPQSMHLNPVKVSYNGLAILSKTFSAYCTETRIRTLYLFETDIEIFKHMLSFSARAVGA